MRDRLIELISKAREECTSTSCFQCEYQDKEMPKDCVPRLIADHLIANGVIVPPCKVGDNLYVISQMKDKRILPFINTYKVTSVSIRKNGFVVYHEMDGYIKIFKQSDFGKTVFLTKAEAEKFMIDTKDGVK